MKCRSVRRRLDEYLRGELAADEQAAIAAHLAACASCRAEAAAIQDAERALTTLGAVEPAPELTADLRRRLGAPAARRLSWRWAGAGAAVAMVTALLVWLSVRTARVQPQPRPAHVAQEAPQVEPPPAPTVEPKAATPAPPPPRPVGRRVVVHRPGPSRDTTAAEAPEPTVTETPVPESPAAEDQEAIAGVILLVGPPQPPAASSNYYLEVTLPDGSKSVQEQAVQRGADGQPRSIRLACKRIPSEAEAADY